jgi:hypothetical protein
MEQDGWSREPVDGAPDGYVYFLDLAQRHESWDSPVEHGQDHEQFELASSDRAEPAAPLHRAALDFNPDIWSQMERDGWSRAVAPHGVGTPDGFIYALPGRRVSLATGEPDGQPGHDWFCSFADAAQAYMSRYVGSSGAGQDARAVHVRVLADAQPSLLAHDKAGLEPTLEGAGAAPRLPDLAGGQPASLCRGPDAGATPNKENAATPAKKPQNQLAPRRPLGFLAAHQY